MDIRYTIAQEGQWYKGNLHCHSTVSDGRLSIEELKAAYKSRGYHFVAFSDHDRFTVNDHLNDPEFIALPSCEANLPTGTDDPRIFHLHVILGTDEQTEKAKLPVLQHMQEIGNTPWEGLEGVQLFIDEMVDRGNLVIINHPHWSINELTDIAPLNNLLAVEIYNHCSEVLENMGHGKIIWESLLREGKKLWAVAADDNHNGHPFDSPYNDSFGGWVMVKAKELSRNAIVEALQQGSFYASTGPEIYDFRIEDGEVVVECSPVEKVYINGNGRQYQIELGPTGENTVTALRRKLRGTETFVRAEIVDKNGGRAFSNPIYLAGG